MIILDDSTYINMCSCVCTKRCFKNHDCQSLLDVLISGSHRAKTRNVFPNYTICALPSFGERDKIRHSCHTHALRNTEIISDTVVDCVGCWEWSALWVGCSIIRWQWPFSTFRFSSKWFWKCEIFQWDDQRDGFWIWDPTTFRNWRLSGEHSKVNSAGGAVCKKGSRCINLRCEWRLNTWPSDLSYSCSHAWSFFAQLLPPQFYVEVPCDLWTKLQSLVQIWVHSESFHPPIKRVDVK